MCKLRKVKPMNVTEPDANQAVDSDFIYIHVPGGSI